jgi:hypothetical protein
MFIQPVNADAIIQSQRTRAGLEFDATREAILDRYQGDRAFKKRMDDLCKRVAITPGSVHTNKFLTNFSVAYRNDAYIGERLLGLVMVPNRSDKYLIWDKRNLMNAPDDLLVARARANEVFFNYTEDNYSLKDYGFKRHVDNETLKNSDDIFRDVLANVEFLAELESLKRELRIAAVVGVAASYSGNSLSLAGSEWNATSSGGIYTGGAPVNAIRTALAARWQGFGRVKKIGFTSLDVFNVLSNHAQIRGLFGLNDSGQHRPGGFLQPHLGQCVRRSRGGPDADQGERGLRLALPRDRRSGHHRVVLARRGQERWPLEPLRGLGGHQGHGGRLRLPPHQRHHLTFTDTATIPRASRRHHCRTKQS